MLNILYFNHYHDSKILGFIYFVGLKCTGSHWSMLPNVKFWIELPKTNPGLAKSHLQQKTRGYAQKTAPNNPLNKVGHRDTCPKLDTCSYLNMSNRTNHWTEASPLLNNRNFVIIN